MASEPNQVIEVFFSYAHKDINLRNELEKHLTILKRHGYIKTWHDRNMMPSRKLCKGEGVEERPQSR